MKDNGSASEFLNYILVNYETKELLKFKNSDPNKLNKILGYCLRENYIKLTSGIMRH